MNQTPRTQRLLPILAFLMAAFSLLAAAADRLPELDTGENESSDQAWFERIESARRPRVTEGVLVDRIVAWVDEDAVTLTELEEALTGYQSESIVEPGPPTEARLQAARERWIDEVLILRRAREAGIEAPPETVDRRVAATLDRLTKRYGDEAALNAVLKPAGYDAHTLRERIHEQLRRDWVIAAAVGRRVEVTDEEVGQFTEERRREGLPTERYYLSQFFLPISDKALESRWEEAAALAHDVRVATANGKNFATVARDWARAHPGEGARVDTLGALDPHELLAPLADAIARTEPGATTPPVRTAKGVHVLYLHRKTTPREMLFARKFEEAWRTWADALRREADIQKVDPILDQP